MCSASVYSSFCEGCDSIQGEISLYRCWFRGSREWEIVHYCPECAARAKANWNGETDAIEPLEE